MISILQQKIALSAILSHATYGPQVPQGFEHLPQFNRKGSDGFQANVYRNIETNQIFIAYRGTDEKADVLSFSGIAQVTDDSRATGAFDSQVAQADSLYRDVQTAFPTQPINLTGHSLGGALAQVTAAKYGAPAQTFEAPGMRHYVERTVQSPAVEQIYKHYRGSDIVPLATGDHVGNTLKYPSVNSTSEFRAPDPGGQCVAPGIVDYVLAPTPVHKAMVIQDKVVKEHSMDCMRQDILGGAQPTEVRLSTDNPGSSWLRPGGGGDALKDGPTYGNWGGGGYSGGVRDDTPMCRMDWKPPANRLDEAFREHDYAYMRDGLSADTDQSNPLKQAADKLLLERLSNIPDSELDWDAIAYKRAAQGLFGAKVAGEDVSQSVSEAYDALGKQMRETWDATKDTASDAWDATKDTASDAWDATKGIAEQAADWAAKKGGEAMDFGDQMVDGAKDALRDASGWAQDKAGGALNWAKDQWNSAWDEGTSPDGMTTLPTVEVDASGFGAFGTFSRSGGTSGETIIAIDDQAEQLADDADGHADRAETAARSARSSARRAAAIAARIRAMLSRRR